MQLFKTLLLRRERERLCIFNEIFLIYEFCDREIYFIKLTPLAWILRTRERIKWHEASTLRDCQWRSLYTPTLCVWKEREAHEIIKVVASQQAMYIYIYFERMCKVFCIDLAFYILMRDSSILMCAISMFYTWHILLFWRRNVYTINMYTIN